MDPNRAFEMPIHPFCSGHSIGVAESQRFIVEATQVKRTVQLLIFICRNGATRIALWRMR